MGAAALLPLLLQLLPLVPEVADQIRGWVKTAQSGGKFTKAQKEQIHQASLVLHARVQEMVAKREQEEAANAPTAPAPETPA